MSVKDFDVTKIPDGNYSGEANLGFNYVVEVNVLNQKIDNIDIKENRDSFYANLAEGVIKKVIQAQSPNVDAVTGATTTSKCLMKAIEQAFEKGLNDNI